MKEKEPEFTVIDRRKFTSEGDVRPNTTEDAAAHDERWKQTPQAPSTSAVSAAPAASSAASGIHAVPQTTAPAAKELPKEEPPALEGPTAEESAQSQVAYSETTRQMDEILRDKLPGGAKSANVGFEHVVQSLYMTAVMHLGAGTPQGEKARIDLMGARQTIDMLEVLAKKTAGNLNENEKIMMDSALFEARMMFLEITNAIARNAAQQAAHPLDPKGLNIGNKLDPKGRR